MPIDTSAVKWDDTPAPIAVDQVQWDDSTVTDLPAVRATLSPEDDPRGFIPPREVPADGKMLIGVVRQFYPEWDERKAAREVAAYYEKQGIPKTDFYRTSGLDKELLGYEIGRDPDPTEGMSFGQKFAAGAGKALSDAGSGLAQFGTEAAKELLGDRTGLTGGVAQDSLGRTIEGQRQETAETRRIDAPLMDTGAGLAGNITGNVGMLVAPGGALKGAASVPQFARAAPALNAGASALLPTTIPGAAASGAALGAIQPSESGLERAGNIALGTVGGTAGAAIPRVAGAAIRGVRNLSPSFTAGQQGRQAAEVIEQFADNPDSVRAALQRNNIIVPGSLPTTAEATEDVGLFGLQQYLANRPTVAPELAKRGIANNQARVAAIKGEFGGADDAAAEAIRSSRDLAARQTLRPIGGISVGDVAPVKTGVKRLIEKNAASKPVREVLGDVLPELDNIKTVQDAHAVRRYVNSLMEGKVEGKLDAKLAKRELMVVRDLLDRQMKQAFPEWGKFLKEYKGASRELGQVETGKALLSKSGAIPDAAGNDVLSPAKFSNAAANMDRTVASATGYRGSKAANVLTPEQLKVVDEVAKDLQRFTRAQTTGKPVKSDTAQNLLGAASVQSAVGPVGAAMIEPVSGVALLGLNGLRKSYGEKVAGIVEEAMLDPQRAAEILAKLPPKSRRMLTKQFVELMNQAGSAGGRSAVPSTE